MASGSRCTQRAQYRHLALEQSDHLWIPLRAGAVLQDRQRIVDCAPRSIRTVIHQGVEGVAHGEDAGELGNVESPQTVWVSVSVEALVMVPDDRQQTRSGAKGPHDPLPDDRVFAHPRQLVAIEACRLEKDGIRHSYLADVVDDA